MSKFTPGPWRQAPDAFYYVETRYGEAVARTIETSNEKESRANARLIAAAPDLLQKLEVMVDIFSRADPDPLQAMVAVEQAKGVIEKATGEGE